MNPVIHLALPPGGAPPDVSGTLIQSGDESAPDRPAGADEGNGPPAPGIPGYRLGERLGTGTFAGVWKAVQIRTGKQVAIKVFHSTGDLHWDFLRREVERLAQLDKHAHVVALLDADLGHRPPYYVTDLIEGGSLAAHVNAARPVPPSQVAGWMEQVARALAFVHGKGIIHCDLKPANILLDEEGGIRVADFGQSRALSDTQGALGTLFYMAPEQARIGSQDMPVQPDIRWDLYAWGAIAYALLTGRPPYADALPARLSGARSLDEQLRVYRELGRTTPMVDVAAISVRDEDLAAIVRKALEPDPDRRYGSVGAILGDLAARRSHRPVGPLAAGLVYRFRKYVRRHRAPLAVGAVAWLLIAGFWIASRAARHEDFIRSLGNNARHLTELGDTNGSALYWAEVNHLRPSAGARANALAAESFLPPPVTRLVHRDEVVALAFSPSGQWVITGSKDNSARVWAARSGHPIGVPMQHAGWVMAVAFSPDGARVATGSLDGTARVWEAATGRPVGVPLRHAGPVHAVAFSPDGTRLATTSGDKTARVWEAATGKQVGMPLSHAAPVNVVAFNAQGTRIVTGSDDMTARIWDARTGSPVGTPLRHAGAVAAVAFSPDGNRIVTGSRDNTARVWETDTGKPVGPPLPHSNWVREVAFSPDGRWVATASGDNTARVWEAVTGKPVGTTLQHAGPVGAVAFSPDGKWVATGSEDTTARLWEMPSGRLASLCRHDGWAGPLGFSPDGKYLAVAGGAERTVIIWDLAGVTCSMREVKSPAWGEGVAMSADGSCAAIGDPAGAVHLLDMRTGTERPWKIRHPGGVWMTRMSRDGSNLLTVGYDGSLQCWDPTTGSRILAGPHPVEAKSPVEISPDGRWVVAANFANAARVWETTPGSSTMRILQHAGLIGMVAFSPDGRLLVTGSDDTTARVWETTTGKPVGPALQHADVVMAVAFSPDGRRVMTGSRDRSARVWDAHTGRPAGPAMQHAGAVVAVRFSPDGAWVATGSDDKTARVWEAATGRPVTAPLVQDQAITCLAFSPDGEFLAVGEYGRSAWIWSVRDESQVGAPLPVGSNVLAVQFSSDQRRLFAIGSLLSSVEVWRTDHLADRPDPAGLLARVNSETRSRINRLGFMERDAGK